jgi:hypothetical protein
VCALCLPELSSSPREEASCCCRRRIAYGFDPVRIAYHCSIRSVLDAFSVSPAEDVFTRYAIFNVKYLLQHAAADNLSMLEE